jgi:hypothetical protein
VRDQLRSARRAARFRFQALRLRRRETVRSASSECRQAGIVRLLDEIARAAAQASTASSTDPTPSKYNRQGGVQHLYAVEETNLRPLVVSRV